MAESKIERQNAIGIQQKNVEILSDGANATKKVNIPYVAGYRPICFSGIHAKGGVDGYTKIFDYGLTDATTTTPKAEVSWVSPIPSSGIGVAVNIIYVPII